MTAAIIRAGAPPPNLRGGSITAANPNRVRMGRGDRFLLGVRALHRRLRVSDEVMGIGGLLQIGLHKRRAMQRQENLVLAKVEGVTTLEALELVATDGGEAPPRPVWIRPPCHPGEMSMALFFHKGKLLGYCRKCRRHCLALRVADEPSGTVRTGSHD